MEEDSLVGVGCFALVIAVCGLAVFGGFELWKQKFEKPDDSCYWLASVGDRKCLLDAAPDGACLALDSFTAHHVACGDMGEMADIAKKAGRRVCGQQAQLCPRKEFAPVPAPSGFRPDNPAPGDRQIKRTP